MYSNAYIFRFATIMVVVVAAVLTAVAMLVKPFQERNKTIEKMQEILSAAGIQAHGPETINLYQQYVIEEIGVDLQGNVRSTYKEGQLVEGDLRPFDVDMRLLIKQIEDLKAGKTAGEPILPLFRLSLQGGDEVLVIPVRGKGLWGPIWGNIALKSDMNTIVGASFNHKGETPGLGAEINQTFFEEQFIGKQILDDKGEFVSVRVVKGGVANSTTIPLIHGVDAISGGTITSDGVTEMLRDCLANYVPFFQKNIAL